MIMTIYLNGKYIQQEQARCVVSFTGGVFETMRAYGGKIFRLSEHIKRLFMSAKFLGMSISYASEELEEICCHVLEHAGHKDAQVRISITNKDLLIIVKQFSQISCRDDVTIITSSLTKQPPLPQAKSSDFLLGVIARAESYSYDPFEIVFLNRHGFVTEGTVSNIFMVRDGVVITPPAYLGLLNGITRQCVLEVARQTGMETRQVPFTRYDLFTADEVFLTNSCMEILPVSVVDGRMVGNGKEVSTPSCLRVCPSLKRNGAITMVLQEGYKKMVDGI